MPPSSSRPVRAIWLSLVLVIGALAVVLAGVSSSVFDLDRHLVPKEFSLHLIALLGVLSLLPGVTRLRMSASEVAFASMVVWTFVSALFATNSWLAFRAAGVGASTFAVFLLARAARRGYPSLVAAGLGLATALGAVIGLAQAYGLTHEVLGTDRLPGGTFGNRNFLAHAVVLGMPLMAVRGLAADRRWTVAAWMVGLGLSTWVVVLTRSRAAWLGLLASGLVIVLGSGLTRAWRLGLARRTPLALAATLALAALTAVLLPNRLAWRSGSPYRESLSTLMEYRSGSGAGRIIQYRNSLRLLADDPILGVGPGNWFVHYPRVTTPGDPSFAAFDPIPTNPWPSSDWVGFLSETGVVGLLLMGLAGLILMTMSGRRLRSADLILEGNAVALLSTLTAVLVMGSFDAVLHLAAPAYLMAVIAGLLTPETLPIWEWEPGRGTMRWTSGAALVLLVVLLASSLGQLASIVTTGGDRGRAAALRAVRFDPGGHRLRLRLAAMGSCPDRLPHARAAVRLLPYHSAPQAMLRRCGG